MKFKKIFKPTNPKMTEFIDMLLSRKIYNDRILETVFFNMTVQLDHPAQWYWRMLWQTSYLRFRERTDTFIMDDNIAQLTFSVSECIGFIRAATPPKFQKRLENELTSIDAIYDMLELFLVEPGDQQKYYHSLFSQIMRLERFEASWIPDKQKIAFVRQSYPDSIMGLVDASTKPLNEIMENLKYDQKDVYIQMTFHAKTTKDIQVLSHFMWTQDMEINNVYADQTGLYISAFSNHVLPGISNLIHRVYSSLKS